VIHSEDLDDYLEAHSSEPSALLQELERETYQKVLQPIMLSGAHQGSFLRIISKLLAPTTVLEIGTYTGYATLCLLEGLKAHGMIHTIDINEELQGIQRKYFNKSGRGAQIVQHLGNALEIIPRLETRFDLVFIDADKPHYPQYLELIVEKLNPGGIILSDNVLWHGKVLNAEVHTDDSTKALLRFNRMIKEHDQLESVMLPLRDGITLSRKR
jgi:predicted O-methyltransferase YrrM